MQVGVPSYLQAANNSTFGIIPGTATGTIAAVMPGGIPGGDASIVDAWNCPIIDTNLMELRHGGGGHGDYGGNEIYACPLSGPTNAFRRLMNPTVPTGTTDAAVNGTNATSSGAMATFHTYGNVEFFDGRTWFMGGSSSQSSGNPTSAIWSWAEADLANGRNGYTYHGKGAPGWVDGGFYNPNVFDAWCAVDTARREIWEIPQAATGTAAHPGAWKIHADTKAITTYTFASPYGHFPGWVVHIPALDILLCCGDPTYSLSPGLWYLPLENPSGGWVQITNVTGTLQGRLADSAVFHAGAGANGKVYVWRGGNTVYPLTIPASRTGTFAFGAGVSIAGTAPTTYAARWYKKMRLVEKWSMLVILQAYNAGLAYVKIPSGGF